MFYDKVNERLNSVSTIQIKDHENLKKDGERICRQCIVMKLKAMG